MCGFEGEWWVSVGVMMSVTVCGCEGECVKVSCCMVVDVKASGCRY